MAVKDALFRNGHVCAVEHVGPDDFVPCIGLNAANGNTECNPEYLVILLTPCDNRADAWRLVNKAFVLLGLNDIKPERQNI